MKLNHPSRFPMALALVFLLSLLLAAADQPASPLTPDRPVSKALSPGRVDAYTITLSKGQYIKVVALQQGIDVVLTAFGPDGQQIAEIDSPNGADGPEPLSFEAPADGSFRFEVKSLDPAAPPGRYEIRVATLLPAAEYAKHREIDLDPATLERYRGNFEFKKGHVLMIAPIGGIYLGRKAPLLQFLNLKTRRSGILHAVSETRFFTGPALMESFPVEADFEFLLDPAGQATGLRWTPAGGKTSSAKRVDPFRYERVSIQNGDVTLDGYLMIPAGKGPFPALIHAHGSQGSTADVGPLGNFFVRQGAAFLSFDKRGAGKSTGNWQTSGMEDLASDILAGANFLKARPEIDSRRIGLWGISQGGWVSAIAAARSTDIAFIIVHSGSGVPVAENMAHEAYSGMRQSNLKESEILEATAFISKVYQLMSDGEPPEKIRTLAATIGDKPWAPYMSVLQAPSEYYLWNWMKLNGNIDSATYLRQVRCPVLWFLGDRDSQVPTARSKIRLEEALRAAGNRNSTVIVLSPANHGLFECKTGLADEFATCNRYVAGYWDTMAQWLAAHVTPTR